jgi:hypothetical protein
VQQRSTRPPSAQPVAALTVPARALGVTRADRLGHSARLAR